MGIRKSYGKNKKNKRPISAIAVKREETLRRARIGGEALEHKIETERAGRRGSST